MTDLGNLIDLSLEDNGCVEETLEDQTTKKKAEYYSAYDEDFNCHFKRNPNSIFNNGLLIDIDEGRPSLDNNPFDRIQKLADREMDPFDIVEKEACLKACQSKMPSMEVKLGNLLSLSDENLTKLDDELLESQLQRKVCDESPNVNMPEGSAMSSSSASDSGSGGGGTGGRSKKNIDLRNRLLKLTLTNSSFNSPVNRKLQFNNNQKDSDDDRDRDEMSSPLSSVFAEAAQLGENLLGSESPLKLVDDDLMMEESPDLMKNDFEADLEMLRIPMLNKLNSPTKSTDFNDEEPSSSSKYTSKCRKKLDTSPLSSLNHLSQLEAIKLKLKSRNEISKSSTGDNDQDVEQLIESLKKLITGIGDENSDKKQQAASLLKTLCKSLLPNDDEDGNRDEEKDKGKPEPEAKDPYLNVAPIQRQSTFDIDLQNKKENVCNAAGGFPKIVIDAGETERQIENIPDCMFKSSATYDGDTNEIERRDYLLPEVECDDNNLQPSVDIDEEPLSPIQPDVNDIVGQISKLLEQHQHQQLESNSTNGNMGMNPPAAPTVIVFMNTSTVGQLPNISNNRRSICVTNSSNEAAEESQQPTGFRRRSQSLSLHDKVKIVSLSALKSPKADLPSNQQQQNLSSFSHHNETVEPSNKSAYGAIKTPSKMMLSRRNSFSNATTSSNALAMSVQRARATEMKLASVNEQARQAIVRPLPPMPMKKKVTNNKTESIMKSTVPLKATIPVKKVAPTLQIKSPTYQKESFAPPETPANQPRPRSFSSSIKLKSKQREIPLTSTPMPRNGNLFNLPTSTTSTSIQALNVITPMKKRESMQASSTTKASGIRSRYSATPSTLKTSSVSASVAGLKRRSLSELKETSPNKVKSTSGVANSSTKVSTAGTRLSMKVPVVASGRPHSRLSLRPGTSSTAAKQKENKQP